MNSENAPDQVAGSSGPSMGRLVAGILLSLFALPGAGHQLVGRKKAFWAIVLVFFLSFVLLGYFLYHIVSDAVTAQMQKSGQLDLEAVVHVAMDSLKNGSGANWSLILLLVVYLGAPIELVVNEGYQRLQASRK